MTITLYSGTPGSGKSLHAARYIYYKLKYNKPVIANFDINLSSFREPENFLYIPNYDMEVNKLIDISRDYFKDKRFREGAITLVLDECQLLFNCREWNKKGREAWLSFFSQHRKLGYNIILIAQFDRMIDRQIRSLIEYEFVHRRLTNFGKAGAVVRIVALGEIFCAIERFYPLNEKLGQEFFRAKKKYYSLYDTYAKFDLEEHSGDEHKDV